MNILRQIYSGTTANKLIKVGIATIILGVIIGIVLIFTVSPYVGQIIAMNAICLGLGLGMISLPFIGKDNNKNTNQSDSKNN